MRVKFFTLSVAATHITNDEVVVGYKGPISAEVLILHFDLFA